MRTLEEVRKLYSTTLEGRLQDLESMRKGVMYAILKYGAILAGILALIIAAGYVGDGLFFVVGVGVIIIGFLVHSKMKKYRSAFKSGVVSEVIKLIDDSWYYNADSHIPLSDYHSSKIFTKGVDRHSGDDYVKGKIDKTDFEFSELHTEYKTESTDSKGNRKTSWHTIFRGILFHADFNKHLKGETFVLPDTAQRLFGKIGQMFQKMNGRGELVKLEDVAFEKKYVVYGSDQIEPRYILTPVMMEKMVQLKQKYKHDLHFSFLGSRVYCAMSISKNMFEPRIFTSGVRFKDVQEMHDYFTFIEVIIHEMNLNTRIWTKD